MKHITPPWCQRLALLLKPSNGLSALPGVGGGSRAGAITRGGSAGSGEKAPRVGAPLATSSWPGLRTARTPLDVIVRNVPRAAHHRHLLSTLFPHHLLLLSLAQLPHSHERQSSTGRDLFPPFREVCVLSLLPLSSRFPPLIEQQLHLACKPNGFRRQL